MRRTQYSTVCSYLLSCVGGRNEEHVHVLSYFSCSLLFLSPSHLFLSFLHLSLFIYYISSFLSSFIISPFFLSFCSLSLSLCLLLSLYLCLLLFLSLCPLLFLSSETLGIANVDYYWYLNQSGTYTVDGTDDKKEFADTLVSS